MKKIIAILFSLVLITTAIAQEIEVRFSNQPFDINDIDKSPIVNEFTDYDYVYGIIIIDKVMEYTKSDLEGKWDDITISYSLYTGKEIKGGNESYFKVDYANNKTYIFIDIFPDTEFVKSRGSNSLGYNLAKIEDGKKGNY